MLGAVGFMGIQARRAIILSLPKRSLAPSTVPKSMVKATSSSKGAKSKASYSCLGALFDPLTSILLPATPAASGIEAVPLSAITKYRHSDSARYSTFPTRVGGQRRSHRE